jgi:hypothetical protein
MSRPSGFENCSNRREASENRTAANFALVKDRLVGFIQDTPPYEGGVPFSAAGIG